MSDERTQARTSTSKFSTEKLFTNLAGSVTTKNDGIIVMRIYLNGLGNMLNG
jgi:hypothetical protein